MKEIDNMSYNEEAWEELEYEESLEEDRKAEEEQERLDFLEE